MFILLFCNSVFSYWVVMVRVMVFNTTFNNITVISWQSVLLVKETGVLWENHWPVASHKLFHIMLYRVYIWVGFELTTLVVIGTDCIGSCKSNYRTITTMTAPGMVSESVQICYCLFMSCIAVRDLIIKRGSHYLVWHCHIFVPIPSRTSISNA
jgi:hypothetical protein